MFKRLKNKFKRFQLKVNNSLIKKTRCRKGNNG